MIIGTIKQFVEEILLEIDFDKSSRKYTYKMPLMKCFDNIYWICVVVKLQIRFIFVRTLIF